MILVRVHGRCVSDMIHSLGGANKERRVESGQ